MTLSRITRIATFATVGILLLFKLVSAESLGPTDHRQHNGTVPPNPPTLLNNEFECTTGYSAHRDGTGQEIFVPNGWQLTTIQGAPMIHSARTFFAGSCDGSAHVERIGEIDSLVIRAEDLERPPEPGKPFDVAFHQQVNATVGGVYSLSGWMLSLCGGSAVPSDCPEDVYIAKMLGIDPTGGTDPTAATVVWMENRRNFWEGERVGWQQLSVTALAQSDTITIFARVSSPSRWHGNHAFIDSLSLVRAPVAELLVPASVTGTTVALLWQGELQGEIVNQPGSTHELRFDVQSRHVDSTDWQLLTADRSTLDSIVFTASCTATNYLFRIRARAEQPDDQEGAWPNHRYRGLWSPPTSVYFVAPPTIDPSPTLTMPTTFPKFEQPFQLYLPMLANQKQC